MENGFLFLLTGFSRKVMVSSGLCLAGCVEMADGHCARTCQEQTQVHFYTLSPGFVVGFSWKMVHTRQVLVSSCLTSVLSVNSS